MVEVKLKNGKIISVYESEAKQLELDGKLFDESTQVESASKLLADATMPSDIERLVKEQKSQRKTKELKTSSNTK